MRLPRPIDVLKGSAIGLQEISRSKGRRGIWEGSSTADVLYSIDCPPPLYVDIHVPGDARRWLKFFLVCDPNWASQLDTSPPPAPTATPGSPMPASRQISIGSPETVLGGPASTYDLGFAIRPADIPKGNIRISLERLAEDLNKWDRPICLDICCVKVDAQGQTVPDPPNTRWSLAMHTDPQSKLLQVKYEEIVKSRIYHCGQCSHEIRKVIRTCCECTDFVVCKECYLIIRQDRSQHPHEFHQYFE